MRNDERLRTIYEVMAPYIVRNEHNWRDYLAFASQFHKHSFDNILLVYAQDEDVSILATRKQWAAIGRNLIPRAKGVAVCAYRNAKLTLDYLFDVSQTTGKEIHPTDWQLSDEMKEALTDRLSYAHGFPKQGFSQALYALASESVADNYIAFDFYLAPYVRMSYQEEVKNLEKLTGEDLKDLYDAPIDDYEEKPLEGLQGKARLEQHAINKTVNRVHQAMEAFIHNMNTIHSRGGNQVVFSSINYGTDTSAEGRCIMREILLSTYDGVGNGETAIFPIQIWKKKRGVNYLPEDRNYDLYQLACKVTARRFFPNFLNLDATFNQNEKWRADDPERYKWEIATMGCRTRVFEDRWGEKTSIARGNLSFSTINIVKLAIECMGIENKQQRIDMFFAKLDNLLDITAKQLDERFQFQKTAMAKQFPLLMKYLWVGAEKLEPTDTIESVINHGTLGIGFIGLAECLKALIGKHHGESEEAQELGLKIVTYMRDRANEFSEKYHHNYSVLATPAEGLSGKFTKKDRKEFGVIPGITDRDYYTNSNHVPVYYKCTALQKAKIEAPYHDLTRGGHIFYVEIDGDATHNPAVIASVVDMMDKYNMGYGSVNHNRNRCLDCGYENADANLEVCPKCGSHHIDKLQRITGYLVGTTDRWNSGKLAELHDRVTHIGGSK